MVSGTSTRTEDDRAGVDPGCRIRSDPSKRTMMLSSRHTRLALALLAMLIAALAHPAAAQSVAKIPTRHVEGGDAVAALALPRRPIAPLVNDATIVDQDAIPVAASTATDGPAPRAAMGEAQETPALHPMRPMRPADATTTAAGEAAPALTPIRPAVVDPTPRRPNVSRRSWTRPSSTRCAPSDPCDPSARPHLMWRTSGWTSPGFPRLTRCTSPPRRWRSRRPRRRRTALNATRRRKASSTRPNGSWRRPRWRLRWRMETQADMGGREMGKDGEGVGGSGADGE